MSMSVLTFVACQMFNVSSNEDDQLSQPRDHNVETMQARALIGSRTQTTLRPPGSEPGASTNSAMNARLVLASNHIPLEDTRHPLWVKLLSTRPLGWESNPHLGGFSPASYPLDYPAWCGDRLIL